MINNVRKAIEDLKAGKLIVLIDDDDREAEGDLVGLAEFVTGETVNFMAKHARGLICAPVSTDIAKRLNLHSMLDKNTDLQLALIIKHQLRESQLLKEQQL